VVAVTTERQVQADLHPPRRPSGPPPALPGLRGVTFTADDGVPLAGWWVPARNGAAVVVAHGWSGNRAQLLPQVAPLAEQGFGLLLLDLRAHGESGGSRCLMGDAERRDVAAAVAFAAAQPGVRAVGVVGFSIGALAAAGAAQAGAPIASLVLESPHLGAGRLVAHDYGRWGALSRAFAAWRFRREGAGLDAEPVLEACRREPRPLVVVGERDDEVPEDEVAALRATCGEENVYIVPGGGHGGWVGAALDGLRERMARRLGRDLRVGEGGP
jgi:pimeloyl-ACP methyl ester carboxylesterase